MTEGKWHHMEMDFMCEEELDWGAFNMIPLFNAVAEGLGIDTNVCQERSMAIDNIKVWEELNNAPQRN